MRGLPYDSVRTVQPDHPVLFRASSSRIALTQTAVLDLPASLEPLWIAGNEPVLSAGEYNGQRLVVTAFSPAQSEQLALLPSFPLILGNALYWCAEESDALAGLLAGGELIRHEAVNNIDEHGLRISGTLARSLHTEEAKGGRTHS